MRAVISALETWFLCSLIQICVAVFFIYRIRNDSSLQYSKVSVNSGQKCNLELPEFFPRTFPISQCFPTCLSLLQILACESKLDITLNRLPAGKLNYGVMKGSS